MAFQELGVQTRLLPSLFLRLSLALSPLAVRRKFPALQNDPVLSLRCSEVSPRSLSPPITTSDCNLPVLDSSPGLRATWLAPQHLSSSAPGPSRTFQEHDI